MENWDAEKAIKAVREAAKKALQICAADLQGKSSREAPIRTGDLRANCSVSPIKEKTGGIEISVGYSLVYSFYQHEHTEFRHPLGGKAKFLSDPYLKNKDRYAEMIKEAIIQALSEGGK